jgi:hypothetical protein
VLEEAGIELEDESEDLPEEEIERFRELLEDISVEDFIDPGDEPGTS